MALQTDPKVRSQPPNADAPKTQGDQNLDNNEETASQMDKEDEAEASSGQSSDAIDDAENLRTDLQRAQEELKASQDTNLRLMAEMENLRKRSVKEREETAQYGQARLLKDLLGVVDNMDRVQKAGEALFKTSSNAGAENGQSFKSLLEGFDLVQKALEKFLSAQGVKKMDALNKPFDPRYHEAMQHKPSAEHPAQTVIHVMQEGYLVAERLLRPALVVVASAQAEAGGEQQKPDQSTAQNNDA